MLLKNCLIGAEVNNHLTEHNSAAYFVELKIVRLKKGGDIFPIYFKQHDN